MVGTKNKGQNTKDGIFGNWKMPVRRSLSVGGGTGNSLQSRSGFTYIELIIVIAVIGILSGLFVTQYPAAQRRARDAERRSDMKQYQTAMEIYANKNNGNYPVVSGTISSSILCDDLEISPCLNDSQNSYNVISSSTEYALWATLEQPQSPVTYFVACSNGTTGESSTQPTGADCTGATMN